MTEPTESLIKSYVFFRDDYHALASGTMKNEAADAMSKIAVEIRSRGELETLMKALAAHVAEHYQTFPWRKPKGAA